ncbi:hypothetical protein CHO22_003613 [Escherichia coli]|nr:hypothetical protein [Escherichia coli]
MNNEKHDDGSISIDTNDGRHFFAHFINGSYNLIEVVSGGCVGIGRIEDEGSINHIILRWIELNPVAPSAELF